MPRAVGPVDIVKAHTIQVQRGVVPCEMLHDYFFRLDAILSIVVF